MPSNFARVDVRFSRKNRERINKLKQEVKLRTGRSISMSRIVDEIVSEFFSKQEIHLAIPRSPDNSDTSN